MLAFDIEGRVGWLDAFDRAGLEAIDRPPISKEGVDARGSGCNQIVGHWFMRLMAVWVERTFYLEIPPGLIHRDILAQALERACEYDAAKFVIEWSDGKETWLWRSKPSERGGEDAESV